MLAGLALIALFGVVDFPGGDATALAQAVAKESGDSVLISVFGNARLNACTFDTKDADAMAQGVKTAGGLVMAPGSVPIFHPGTLPRHLVELRGVSGSKPSGFNLVAPPPEALKDGKFTWETKRGEAMRIGDLRGLSFSKPVDQHWMFGDIQIVVISRGLSELEFLTRCAKASGAKLVSSKAMYRFELDPNELRIRAKRTFDQAIADDKLKSASVADRSGIELTKAAIASASSLNLMQAFETQGSETRIQVGPSNVGAVYARMQALSQSQPDQIEVENRGRGGGGQRTAIDPSMLRQLDPRNVPTWLVLRSNFQTIVEMRLPGPGGRGGRTIRF